MIEIETYMYFDFFYREKKINAELPYVSEEVLETQCQDIKNLYYLCVMIVTGKINPALEKMSLPVLHNARWFTLAISNSNFKTLLARKKTKQITEKNGYVHCELVFPNAF